MQPELIELRLHDKKLTLGNQQLTGVENFEIKISSAGLRGTAELTVKMLVKFADSMQGQNP